MKCIGALLNTKYRLYRAGTYVSILLLMVSCRKESDPGPSIIIPEEIAPEQRMKMLEACEEKYASLSNRSSVEAQMEMAKWFVSQPEFIESGYNDTTQNAWAIFADGRFLMIASAYTPATTEEVSEIQPTISNDETGYIQNARTKELPTGKKALLFSGLGNAFFDARSLLGLYFSISKTDYTAEQRVAGIEELKTVDSQTAIFYINTHGARATPKKGKIKDKSVPAFLPGLWTSDKRSIENEIKYKEDLNNYLIGYMVAGHDKGSNGKMDTVTHYAITDRFIQKHMSFSENSLIYVDACGSFRTGLGLALVNKAINERATYIGWSSTAMQVDALKSSSFLFDRLLGTDAPIPSKHKEEPPQRPFDVASVVRDLKNKGLGTSTVDGVKATLEFTSSTGADTRAMLAPSIAYLDIDEYASKLTLYGIFGEDPRQKGGGDVTVDGRPVNSIDSWQKDKIICTIPHKGKGAAGNVIVKVRGHQSNAVPLTEWYIDFLWSEKGSQVKREAKITLHLRADVHRYRNYAGEKDPNRVDNADVDDAFPNNVFAKDSKAVLTASGSCSYTCPCNPGQVTHSNTKVGPDSVSLPYSTEQASVPNTFFAFYGWDSERTTVTAFGFGADMDSFKEREDRQNCTGGSSIRMAPQPFPFSISDGLSDQPLKLELVNADGFDFRIKSGEKSFGTIALEYCQCFGSPEVPIKLTWKESTPRFAPTDKTTARTR